jgi:hypothetical protein
MLNGKKIYIKKRWGHFTRPALCLILSAFFLIISFQWGHAVEKWTRVDGIQEPFRIASSVVSFKGKIFLGDDNLNQTWVTVDGSSWTATGNPPYFHQNSLEHNGYLYGIECLVYDPSGQYELTIHRTLNGFDWTPVYRQNQLSGLGSAVVYQEQMYIFITDGRVLRFDGQLDLQGQLVMEEFAPPPIFPSRIINMTAVELRGYLHAFVEYYIHDDGYFSEIDLFRTDSSLQWETVGSIGSSIAYFKQRKMGEVFENKIYVDSGMLLFSTTGETIPFEWDTHAFQYTTGIPFVLHDSLYLLHGNDVKILSKLLPDGSWEIISIDLFDFNYSDSDSFYAETDDLAAITGNNNKLLLLKAGLTTLEEKTISTDRFFSGQKNAGVLSFSGDVNIHDLLDITVKNQGTAVQGQHIERVYLTKKEAGTPTPQQDPFVVELEPDLTDPQKWRTSQPVLIHDEDELNVKVDIKEGVLRDATVLFFVEPGGIKSLKNPNFSNETPLLSTSFINIQNASAAGDLTLLADVEVAPRPARDVVNFVYDLAEASDVEIKIFDRSGGLVSEIHDPNKSAGNRAKTQVNVASFAPGVYYSVIKIKPATGGEHISKQAVYIER